MNRVMKLKSTGACHLLVAALTITLLSVSQAFAASAVTISWDTPADIVYGTALSASELDATAAKSDTGAAVTGNFSYNPVLGTVLPAGTTQVLTVTFTPTKASEEDVESKTVTTTVQINVAKAALSVTAPNRATTYGAAGAGTETAAIAALLDSNYDALSVSGLVAGDTVADALNIGGRADLAVTGVSGTTKASTSHAITFSNKPSSSNYDVTYVNGTLTINKKAVVLNAPDASTVYGHDFDSKVLAKSTVFDISGSTFEAGDRSKIQVNQLHNVDKNTGVGSYDISLVPTETSVGVLSNYDVTTVAGSITVAARPVTVNLLSKLGDGAVHDGGDTIVYGAAHPVYSATYTIVESGATWDLSDVAKTGDALKATAGIISSPVVISTIPADSGFESGGYKIGVSGGTFVANNFTVAKVDDTNYSTETLVINRAPLTVQATDKSMVVNALLPAVDYSLADAAQLKHGDTSAEVLGDNVVVAWNKGALGLSSSDDGSTLTVKRNSSGAVIPYTNAIDLSLKSGAEGVTSLGGGVYAIGNYDVSLADKGDLTVNPVSAAISWAIAKSTITYGDAFSTGTAEDKYNNLAATVSTKDSGGSVIGGTWTWSSKLVSTDPHGSVVNITGAVNMSTGVSTVTPDAGVYEVTATFTPSSNDYGAASISHNLTVAKKTLEVTANPPSSGIAYGSAKPTIGVTYKAEDFVLGDNSGDIATDPTVTHGYGPTTNVGEYDVTPAGGEDENYVFNYKSAKLKINKAATSVTWDPADTTITYGESLASVGSANAEGPADIPGSIVYSVNENDGRAITVKTTSITATFVSASPNHADSSALAKSFTVSPKPATVTPGGATITYGDDVPTLSGTSDFLDADGIVVSFTTAATKYSAVGSYLVTASYEDSKGRLENYSVSLKSDANSRVVIDPATLSVEAVAGTGTILNDVTSSTEAAQKLRLSGLRAEAAVLNGVALTSAQLTALTAGSGSNSYTDSTPDPDVVYNNADNDDTFGGGNVKDMPLLGRVFGSKVFSLDIDGTDATKAVDYPLNVIVSDGSDPVVSRLSANYVLGTNTSATFSIGKEAANIDWPAVSAITYGTKLSDTQLDATVVQAKLKDDSEKLGTFTYRIGSASGPAAKDAILGAGEHTLHVTYEPHADDTVAYTSNTETVKITVNKAPLTVKIKQVTGYTYGDPLPMIMPSDLEVETLINGDTAPAIFEPINGGIQPVVAISPASGHTNLVAGTSAKLSFGQLPGAANYTITTSDSTMPIARRELTVKAADTSVTFGNTTDLTLEYANFAPGEDASVLGSPGYATVTAGDISSLSPTTYTIFAQGAYGSNYIVTHVTGVLTVAKAAATITIANSEQVYDGSGKSVTITTDPAGLSSVVTYDGGTALPVDAGTYALQVDVNSDNYSGTATGSLTITAAPVTFTIGSLSHIYDGSAKEATVVSDPAGVAATVTYDGGSDLPIDAGSHAVAATPTSGNYSGSSTADLVISKATAAIAVSGNTQVADGNGKSVVATTTPAGLETSVVYSQDVEVGAATAAATEALSAPAVVNLGDLSGSTSYAFSFIAKKGGASTAIAGNNAVALKLDQWNEQGVFGMTVFGVADHLFEPVSEGSTSSVFDENVHVVYVNDTDLGQTSLYINGALAGTLGENFELSGDTKVMGARLEQETDHMGEGSIMSTWASYNYALSADEVAVLAGIPTEVEVASPTEPGAYKAVVTVVDDNYTGSIISTLAILPGAEISITDLRSIYSGDSQEPTISVNPSNLAYSVTYNKSTKLPKSVGAYDVEVTINDSLYSGSESAKFTIFKGQGSLEFVAESLESPWTSPVAPSVITTPEGLPVLLTYNGIPSLPNKAGEYEVEAIIVDPNYAGSGSATFTLGKGEQIIKFPAIPNLTINGNSVLVLLNAYAVDSNGNETGLPIEYTVTTGQASIERNLLTISQPGNVSITARQLGNQTYLAAEEKVRSFNVTGTGVPIGAPQSVAKLNDDGSIGISTQGQPFQELSIYASGAVDGSYDPIVKLMLDENGRGTFNTETEEGQRFFQVK